ncbi:MAG: hypothetical protein HYY16_10750 [Planctomycetes bacterium]|nr:hypothetical protein [Planctomycetota bacterium]
MRVLLIAASGDSEERLRAGLTSFRIDLKVASSLEQASDYLTIFWPDAVIVDMEWSERMASWVYRNLVRYWVKTIVTHVPDRDMIRGPIYLRRGDAFGVAQAMGVAPQAAAVAV